MLLHDEEQKREPRGSHFIHCSQKQAFYVLTVYFQEQSKVLLYNCTYMYHTCDVFILPTSALKGIFSLSLLVPRENVGSFSPIYSSIFLIYRVFVLRQ